MSEPAKITIDCAVCRDLAPLVQDGVASESSARLVREHLAACADCRALFPDLAGEGQSPPVLPEPDDGRVLRAVRERIHGLLLLFMMGGILVGNLAMFSENSAACYLLIFPVVTGVARWLDARQWRLAPLLACAMELVPVWFRYYQVAQGPWRPLKALIHATRACGPLWLLLILLCLAGALAARLFRYAVKGEKTHEKTER